MDMRQSETPLMLAKCSTKFPNQTSSPGTIFSWLIRNLGMERIFKRLPNRDVITWNLLISGYCLSGLVAAAVKAFNTMLKDGSHNLTKVTFMTMLQLPSSNRHVSLGRQILGHIIKRGFESYLKVASPLLDMYAKVGLISEAKKVFYGVDERNTVMYKILNGGPFRLWNDQRCAALVPRNGERFGFLDCDDTRTCSKWFGKRGY